MTRHLQIRVEEDVYERLEQAAKERGTSLNTVGREAIMAWLKGEARTPSFGSLEKSEEAILRGVLGYIRAKPYSAEKAPVIALFEALGKRYAGK